MLRLTGHSIVVEYQLITDDYVPLTFENLEESNSITYLYIAGRTNTQMLEIGVDSNTGVIQRVILPMLPEIGRTTALVNEKALYIRGVPKIDVSAWPAQDEIINHWDRRIIKDTISFTALITDNTMMIRLSPDQVVTYYATDDLYFGANELLELVEIKVCNMSSKKFDPDV